MAATEEVAVAVAVAVAEVVAVDAAVGEDVAAEAGDVAVDEVTVPQLSSWPTPCRCRGLPWRGPNVLRPGSTTTTVADVAAEVVAAVVEVVDGVILPVAEEAVVAASWHLPLALEVEVASMVRLISCVALASY